MKDLRGVLRRLFHSAVVWSWAMNGFRLASGILLLPLLLDILPKPELGIYYLFLQLYALLPVIDLGFSVSVGRYVSYAMGGARELKPLGLIAHQKGREPNLDLLWQLLQTTRRLFQFMSIGAFVLMGGIGTWAVSVRVHDTADPSFTWMAWAITLSAAVLEIYAGWWNVFLRGMNQVLVSARISVAAYATKLLLACALLLAGAGLLAVPIASLASSLILRVWSRHLCLKRLGPRLADAGGNASALLKVMWPTSWRAGLQFLSLYLATHANGIICMTVFGLVANAAFGLSLQVTLLIQGMASVWTLVKWPIVGQYRAREDTEGLRQILWGRIWLQAITYIAMAVAAWWFGPLLLQWHGSGKELLPPALFAILLLNGFMEINFSFWTTLLSTENRVPSLWPTVISNVCSLILVLILVNVSTLGMGALVIPPLLTGMIFGYWYWPFRGAKSLKTSWLRYTFLGPDRSGA